MSRRIYVLQRYKKGSGETPNNCRVDSRTKERQIKLYSLLSALKVEKED